MGKADYVLRVTVRSVQTVIAPVLHVDSEDLIFKVREAAVQSFYL